MGQGTVPCPARPVEAALICIIIADKGKFNRAVSAVTGEQNLENRRPYPPAPVCALGLGKGGLTPPRADTHASCGPNPRIPLARTARLWYNLPEKTHESPRSLFRGRTEGGAGMLRLIIGKAGTGKTAAIYRELRRSVELGERRRMLLVPEQYSH